MRSVKTPLMAAVALSMAMPVFATAPANKTLEAFGTPLTLMSPAGHLSLADAMRQVKRGAAKAPQKAIKKEPGITVTSGVKAETIVDEDFSKWTKGTQAEPCAEAVTDEEAAALMSYPGSWALFDVHEAGGAAYMSFDEVGDDGPGYIMSPGIDVMNGDEGFYRFTVNAKNVNANAQDQPLQAFFMDGEASQMMSASSRPMAYDEWTECQWIGKGCASTQFMILGWQGKVLVDHFTVEKLIFPLDTPVVSPAVLDKEGYVSLSWQKVEGANEYVIDVMNGFDFVSETVVGNVDSCILDFDIDPNSNYSFYVMARNGEDISYWGYGSGDDLIPSEVGTAEALEASDVADDGFTANWTTADYATNYLVLPVLTHTAVADEPEFYILNDDFSNVPEDADAYNPIQIAPMLGYGGADIYMSRAGWSLDMGIFMRLTPELPALVLTNMYADYGLPGALVSPATDFSVGNGEVHIAGLGLSGGDDVVVECSLTNADGEVYSSEEFEVSTEGDMFDVTLTGGQTDSYLTIKITDSMEGGDMLLMPMLAVSVSLNEGQTITVPAETVRAANVRSARVEAPVDADNTYTYAVQGYFSSQLMGEISNSVEVSLTNAISSIGMTSEANAYIANGNLNIANPQAQQCVVYSIDGKVVYSTSANAASIPVEKGSYIVRIGQKTMKLTF